MLTFWPNKLGFFHKFYPSWILFLQDIGRTVKRFCNSVGGWVSGDGWGERVQPIQEGPYLDYFLNGFPQSGGASGGASRWRVCYQRSLPHSGLLNLSLFKWGLMFLLYIILVSHKLHIWRQNILLILQCKKCSYLFVKSQKLHLNNTMLLIYMTL